MINVKIHNAYRKVVAVCDSDLIGKKFEEGKMQLEVRETFFKGEEIEYDQVVLLMRGERREDSTFNIVGKESIKAALEAGIIDEGNVLEVQGVPFTLILI